MQSFGEQYFNHPMLGMTFELPASSKKHKAKTSIRWLEDHRWTVELKLTIDILTTTWARKCSWGGWVVQDRKGRPRDKKSLVGGGVGGPRKETAAEGNEGCRWWSCKESGWRSMLGDIKLIELAH